MYCFSYIYLRYKSIYVVTECVLLFISISIHPCFYYQYLQPIGLHPGKYDWAGRQAGGDCSFKINEVNIQYDDGLWECQVTSSSFEAQDQLASKPARLVVRGRKNSLLLKIYLDRTYAEIYLGLKYTDIFTLQNLQHHSI